jgi:hypothetical protein
VRLIVETNSLTGALFLLLQSLVYYPVLKTRNPASVAIIGAILFSVSVRLPSLLPIHPTQLSQITQHPAYNVLPLPVRFLSSHSSLTSSSHPISRRTLILPELSVLLPSRIHTHSHTVHLQLRQHPPPRTQQPCVAKPHGPTARRTVQQQNQLRRA